MVSHLSTLIYLGVWRRMKSVITIARGIDDSSPQGGDKDIYSVGEDNSNMCKDVVKEMELT